MQIKFFFMSDYFVLELFVVSLHAEVAVCPARALNCVFYVRHGCFFFDWQNLVEEQKGLLPLT